MIILSTYDMYDMVKMRQILIIGNNDNGCTPEIEKIAYDAGKHVAESNSVLITGGLGGVMKAASHGAKDGGGLNNWDYSSR